MAGSAGPTVKLTFAGDASNLDKAMSNVGASSEKMSKPGGESSDKIKGAFDTAGDGADGAEGKFQGVADVTSGIVDGFQVTSSHLKPPTNASLSTRHTV